MRAVWFVVLLAGCGRIGFDPFGGSGDGHGDGGGGSGSNPRTDSGVALSCGHYTTLEECRREPGCTPMICSDCPCEAPTMAGCVGRGDTATMSCPASGCIGCCTSAADCDAMSYCLAPDDDPLCGLCVPEETDQPCFSDSECTDAVCSKKSVCSCNRTCNQIACTKDLDCAANQYCTASGHCLARTCTGDAECPPDFSCAAGLCERKSCSTDAECSAYCVEGACYSGRGVCQGKPL